MPSVGETAIHTVMLEPRWVGATRIAFVPDFERPRLRLVYTQIHRCKVGSIYNVVTHQPIYVFIARADNSSRLSFYRTVPGQLQCDSQSVCSS